MADEKSKNHVYESYLALGEILKRYPRIQPREIQYFAPVYYPIAIIEMDFDERTFEDFEEIQLTVLKLVSIGITEPEIISETLGIHNVNYISEVLHLLKGYGHINESGITGLGLESLREEKKILFCWSKQKFQMDALNGTLIRLEQNLIDTSLLDRTSTEFYIAHISPADGIESERVEQMIRLKGLDYYGRYRSSILNTNLKHIHDMSCTDVQYAKCYLMKVRHEETTEETTEEITVVFAKRYDSTAKKDEDRFAFKPLSYDANSEFSLQIFQGQGIPHNSPETSFILKNLLYLMNDKMVRENNKQKKILSCIRRWNSKVSVAVPENQDLSLEAQRLFETNLNSNNFKGYSGSLLFFLDAINLHKEFLITSPALCGRLISLKTEDPIILATAFAYGELKKSLKPAKIIEYIRESYILEKDSEELQGEKLFEGLLNYFKELLEKIKKD